MSECNAKALTQLAKTSAEDLKGKDITVLDLKGRATFTDVMVFVTGTSTRHVKSIALNIVEDSKKAGCQPIGSEGETDAEWVLIDLGDVIVHVMTKDSRDFYQIEDFWTKEV
ncbi:MAG: ribosome silencing factor [Gammaproteobacteria bacterium]|nr:ribosome silencing factor [Gammaproteobacteria bacterium]